MIIYKITNILNGKLYIGKTIKSLEIRKNNHLKNIRSGHSSKLYNSIRKNGIDCFLWEEIIKCYNINSLNELECFYIKKYNSFKKGYNMTMGGDGGDTISMKSNSEKKKQGAKSGNIPWNKGVNMKDIGYTFFKNRKSRKKFTNIQKKEHSLKIKNSEKFKKGIKERSPSKQIIIQDDLGNIWNKLKDFKTYTNLSRFKIMTPLLKGDWKYNGRIYKIIYIKGQK